MKNEKRTNMIDCCRIVVIWGGGSFASIGFIPGVVVGGGGGDLSVLNRLGEKRGIPVSDSHS